jgi:glutamate-1-semialdehyde 2,1-aminomutase
VPASVLDETIVVPFNDVEAIEDALKAQGDTIAAIILEPVIGSGGGVEPLPGYLQGIRQLADDYGTLLIFDEVLTFRLGYGGLQGHYDVRPDLTAIGKIIGGGLPVGAFGGRRDIMAAFNPLDPKTLVHSGTFNGNNITMAAGLATMRAFGDTEVARINHLGDRLINGLSQALSANGIQAHASGPGSVVRIQWQAEKVRTGREAAQAKNAVILLPKLIHLELMNRGIFLASRCQFAVSTPMTEIEIDQAILAFGEALTVVRPYIADEVPHLLST